MFSQLSVGWRTPNFTDHFLERKLSKAGGRLVRLKVKICAVFSTG